MGQDINAETRGQVGAQIGADGSRFLQRQGKTGELVVAAAHGALYEPASRGSLYIASNAVAGVAPGTALSTAPAFTIWNPTASGILVAIKKVYLGYLSGTLGAGFMVHSYVPVGSQPAAPTSGTELTPVSARLDTSRGRARVFTGSTIAITSLILRPSLNLVASAGAGIESPAEACDNVDGSIVLQPGAAWCYQGVAAAGSTPKVVISAVFEEIPTP